MRRASLFPARTLTFYGFLPWFLARLTALLIAGAKCVELAVRWGSLWWLIGLALCAITAFLLTVRYNTEVVIVQEATMVCRRGTLLTREMTLPLWPLVLEIKQNLIGRALNYGTVRLHVDDTTIELSNIAHTRFLRAAIAQRQAEILLSSQHQPTPPRYCHRSRAA